MKKTVIALGVLAATGQHWAMAGFRVEGEPTSAPATTVIVAPAPVAVPVPRTLPPAPDAQRVQALEQENAALKLQLRSAEQQIASLMAGRNSVAAVDSGALTVNFDPAGLRFKRSSERDRALVERAMSAKVIHVTGHTDSVGDAAINERVARLRAEAVKNYLVRQGVPEHKIKVEGQSGVYAASNQTSDGRAANRRAVVTFG